jgi:hypothetical protein
MTNITPIDIRTKLTAALTLGTYTDPSNTVYPAIYTVTNLDTDPPRDWQVSGLEVLIRRGKIRNPRRLTGGVADLSRYKIELIQHDRTKGLDREIDTILQIFPRTKIANHYPQTEEIDEQVHLLLPCEYFISS